jgi:hypothetical protein
MFQTTNQLYMDIFMVGTSNRQVEHRGRLAKTSDTENIMGE